jgi:hypothetical protein
MGVGSSTVGGAERHHQSAASQQQFPGRRPEVNEPPCRRRGNIMDVHRSAIATAGIISLAVLAAACTTDAHPIGQVRSLPTARTPSTSTTAAVAASTTTTTAALPVNFHSVQWGNVSVPAAVCDASGPIQLTKGNATIATPAGVNAGTPQVDISEWSSVVYGDLYGTGQQDVAALNVFCSNTGGTADGQLQNSWVIYGDMSGTLQTLTTLTPQQPSAADTHVPIFSTEPGGIEIQPGEITVKEAWYGSSDSTCCPTGQAMTVWTFSKGAFTPTTTVLAYPMGT